MNRRLFLGGAAALIGAGAAKAALLQPTPPSAVTAYARRLQDGLGRTGNGRFIADSEDALFEAHQRIRAEHGLPSLAPHRGLAEAARAHAADQQIRGFFAHESPDGFGPAERVGILARTFLGLPGENIVDYRGSYLGVAPEKLMTSWMESPGHRENILREAFTHVGLGVCQVGRRTVGVACFGQRFAELERPIPFAPTAQDIAAALETARPAIHAYELSPIGSTAREGAYFDDRPSPPLPSGAFILRPRLEEGRRYTLVYGPIVELAG